MGRKTLGELEALYKDSDTISWDSIVRSELKDCYVITLTEYWVDLKERKKHLKADGTVGHSGSDLDGSRDTVGFFCFGSMHAMRFFRTILESDRGQDVLKGLYLPSGNHYTISYYHYDYDGRRKELFDTYDFQMGRQSL